MTGADFRAVRLSGVAEGWNPQCVAIASSCHTTVLQCTAVVRKMLFVTCVAVGSVSQQERIRLSSCVSAALFHSKFLAVDVLADKDVRRFMQSTVSLSAVCYILAWPKTLNSRVAGGEPCRRRQRDF
jgi:hypothetical protein